MHGKTNNVSVLNVCLFIVHGYPSHILTLETTYNFKISKYTITKVIRGEGAGLDIEPDLQDFAKGPQDEGEPNLKRDYDPEAERGLVWILPGETT